MPIVRGYLSEKSEDYKSDWERARFIATFSMADPKEVNKITFPWDIKTSKEEEKEAWAKHRAWVRRMEEKERERLEKLSKETNLSKEDRIQVEAYLKRKNG